MSGSAPPQPSSAWIDASRFAQSPREIGTIDDAVAQEFKTGMRPDVSRV